MGEVNRYFQEEWSWKFFVYDLGGDVVQCLLCSNEKPILILKKVYNIGRHFREFHNSTHGNMGDIQKKQSAETLSLKKRSQVNLLTAMDSIQVRNAKCSYIMAEMLAKTGRPFTDGQFFKEALLKIVEQVAPSTLKSYKSIPLSDSTMQRRIVDLGDDSLKQLKKTLENVEYYSICLDESADITSNAQIVLYIRYVLPDFSIEEKLAGVISIVGSVNGQAVFDAIVQVVQNLQLDWQKLVELANNRNELMAARY